MGAHAIKQKQATTKAITHTHVKQNVQLRHLAKCNSTAVINVGVREEERQGNMQQYLEKSMSACR